MDTTAAIVSWMRESWNALPRFPFDPGFWIVLLAVLLLAYLWSIVRSVNRLRRQLSSAVTELGEIRSALRRIERVLEQSQGKPSPAGKEGRDIWNLPLRGSEERP